MGSDNIENWMKSSYKADENGNYPVSFKVDIKESKVCIINLFMGLC